MAEFQLSLGDPAGQANSRYWDSWFQSVSNGSRFEWYVSSSTSIARLLEVSLSGPGSPRPSPLTPSTRVLHGGSGNSELIFDLAELRGMTDAVALDISPVAVDEMTSKVALRAGSEPHLSKLQFVLHDVLEPLPFPPSSFDAFLDKGLFDAMMSSADEPYQTNASLLFSHVHSALRPSQPYICITLAESHVVRLFLSAVAATAADRQGGPCWGPLNIFELKPDDGSSSLRPFAFVMHAAQAADGGSLGTVNFFGINEDGDDAVWSTAPSWTASFPSFEEVDAVVSASRQAYDASVKAKRKTPQHSLSLLTFDVKPYECECDLLAVYSRLTADDGPCGSGTGAFEPPIVWREHGVEPIGFGVSKLVVTCVLNSDDVEKIVDVIQEEEQDAVQSVDIVRCVPVATDLSSVFKDQFKLGK